MVGLLGFLDINERQTLSRELIGTGVVTTARSVRIDVEGIRDPLVEQMQVEFRTTAGEPVRAVLYRWEDDPQGMLEGSQEPRTGTRYAMPLQIVYRASDPSTVLATADAHRWLAKRNRRLSYAAMLTGGTLAVFAALGLLTIGARRRGLAWWQWYTEVPSRRRP
ncbi:MAG TPA: hypothetical protein VGL05_33930 [Kribbella sp.]